MLGDEMRRHWRVVLMASWGCGVGVTGLPFYSLSTFVPLFERQEGWDRGAITAALLTLTIGMLVGGPVIGRLVDRYGARRVTLGSIPLFAAGLLLPALARDAPWTLWLGYFAMAALGMGAGPVTYTRFIVQRFELVRGLALGITLAGTGLTALLLPPVLAAITRESGIAGGYVALALLALSAWPLVWFATRGEAPAFAPALAPEPARPAIARPDTTSPGSGDARLFPTLAATFFVVSLGLAGIVVHLVAMMGDVGLSAEAAAGIASGVGLGVIGARVIVGWVIDRVRASFVAAAVFTAAAVGCVMLAYGGAGVAFPAAALVGIALGAEVDLVAFLVSRYFPRERYARIYGWQFGFFAIGAGLSPLFIDALRAADGGYAPALIASAVAAVAAAALLLTLGPYRH
jgi:MFS family permease